MYIPCRIVREIPAMNGPNVFVAQTPLQLLNLIEAQKAFNKTGEVLLFYRQDYNRRHMQNLLDLYDVEQYSFFKITLLFRLIFIPRLFLRYASRRGRVKTFFFGTYASWSAFLANLLQPDELVLVDDGHKTINILTNSEAEGVMKKRFLPCLSKSFLSRASFFTYYSDLARSLGREAVHNSLEHVIRSSNLEELSSLDGDSIIFIGTNILHDYEGIEDVLCRITDTAQGRRVLYVMHRYDNPDLLLGLLKRDDFDVAKFDYPLELVFGALWLENKPEVWTMGTTAIDTLAIIYPEFRVKVFELDYQRFLSEKKAEGFRSLLGFYRKQPHIEVISEY